MKTNDILLLVLLMGGGYAVYYFLNRLDSTGVPIPIQPVYQRPNEFTAPGLKEAMLAASEGNTLKDDQGRMVPNFWTYYYNQVKNTRMWPEDFTKAFGDTEQTPISLDDYISRLQTHGLAGVRAGLNIGAIVAARMIPSLPSVRGVV